MESAPVKAVTLVLAFILGVAASWLLSGVTPGAPTPDAPATDPAVAAYRYKRVIAMSPAAVEIVYAVGGASRVVGVCEHAVVPPEAFEHPTCGGAFNPNLEMILALRPDLVVTQGEAEDLVRFGCDNGIEIASLPLSDLESVFASIAEVGRLLETGAEADVVCAEMRWRMARVRARASSRVPVHGVLVAWRDPGALTGLSVVGPGSFLHDLMEAAGARNVFADLPGQYAPVSKEALLERGPDVIVELHGEGGSEQRTQREARRVWQSLPSLPAVQNGRVYALESTYAMIPGPRVVELAERLIEVFHPEEAR